jgi:SAM-dependent methyltransferase
MGLKQALRKLLSVRNNCWRREEWVKAELALIPAGKSLLDAGCGPQEYRKYCSHLVYKGQDFGQYDGKGNLEGLQQSDWRYGKLDYFGNVWEIEERDEAFDAILCTEVLEHVPYPNESIREFARLLKPGGVLLLTAPFSSLPHMEPYYFYGGFSRYYYRHFLEANGFEIKRIDPNGNAFEYLAQETVRSKQYIRNPLLKIVYMLMAYGLTVPLLKLLARLDTVSNKSLVFGYHVKAVKAGGENR